MDQKIGNGGTDFYQQQSNGKRQHMHAEVDSHDAANNIQDFLDLDMSDMTDVVMDPALAEINSTDGTSYFDTLLGSWAEMAPFSPDFALDDMRAGWSSSNTTSGNSIPISIVDHPTIIQAEQNWQVFRCNPQNITSPCPNIAIIHMRGLDEILSDGCQWLNSYSWQDKVDPSPHRRISIEPCKFSHRERLLAIIPFLLMKARTVHVDCHKASSVNGSSGAVSPIVVILPQLDMFDRLLRIYGNRFGFYHQLIFGHTLRPDVLMEHSNSLVSTLPMLMMIAFGVSTIPTLEARHMASGLAEICRISLQDLIERDVTLITDTKAFQCALLFLMFGIWSGDKFHMDVSLQMYPLSQSRTNTGLASNGTERDVHACKVFTDT